MSLLGLSSRDELAGTPTEPDGLTCRPSPTDAPSASRDRSAAVSPGVQTATSWGDSIDRSPSGEVLEHEDVPDVGDVRLSSDVGREEVAALAEARERGREGGVPVTAEASATFRTHRRRRRER
jgi:hypothetical protein